MLAQALRRSALLAVRTAYAARVSPVTARATAVRNLQNFPTPFAVSGEVKVTEEDIEHATGIELRELEAAVAGKDLFLEEDSKWLNAPFGTLENPVVVTSMFTERIVGAVDPDDDSIVCWGLVKLGEAPVKIGDEFFVLKQIGESPQH
mmetsp:Transcript_20663/g.39256  ORF Transcript_20663/g.39256 Transcript_20663/m.39256 type:complete len:148 (+) Transcript_20663:98-541(+)|eukprot:CAMPEP_0114251846 /NCGR_PEP_ID=MMETSP0058-20121206/15499_1 /TAXON_ID=36894 /ORGANISM="Pyramimonas parkeae, CCMP726" /LENGTH=147 /DNA_ID=CAMNT_0001365697 /DNA_START=70 /DNA_END=513 /DNA_ORIENTATION=+